jgi:hypothetical protein
MKRFSHPGRRKIPVLPCVFLFCALAAPSFAADHTAVVRSVRLLAEDNGAVVEIVADQPITPQIQQLDSPHRLVIDLPYSDTSLRGKRLGSQIKDIKAVRVDEYTVRPPVARVVVDLEVPTTYRVETIGQRILVHLRPEEHTPPKVPALTRGEEPAAVPVSPGGSGGVTIEGSKLATGSSISAGSETAILHLTRGGEVRVCSGTTVSVTSSKGGAELMLGISTGAMEAHYSLGAAADSVLTPDFRVLLAGPGEFDYAMSVNAHGDTCVRTLPGNTAPLLVSELMGEGTYQVKPNEQVVFHSGQLEVHDADVPLGCGCGAPRPEVMRASESPVPLPSDNLPSSARLAQPGDSGRGTTSGPNSTAQTSNIIPQTQNSAEPEGLPATGGNEVHVQVEAPLVFQGRAPHVDAAPLSEVAALPAIPPPAPKLPTIVALPPARAEHHGFFGSIGHFFKSIFH